MFKRFWNAFAAFMFSVFASAKIAAMVAVNPPNRTVSARIFSVKQAWTDRRLFVPIAHVLANQRGAAMVDKVWDIAFVLIFIALLVPIGITQLNSADTDGWDSTQVLVFGLIGTIAILVIAYAVYKNVGGSVRGGGRRRR